MVAYDYDSNTIHAETMKFRKGGELKAAYMKIQALLAYIVLKPKGHFLDNECVDIIKKCITEVGENMSSYLHTFIGKMQPKEQYKF